MPTTSARSTVHALRRCTALAVTAALAAGALALAASTVAQAADDTDSALTVRWAGDNEVAVQQYQPDRIGTLPGFVDDFGDLEVTVSQTGHLRDQAVTVGISGMNPTSWAGNWPGAASNYVQLMQCWGPDPLAADFAQTCQYGINTSPNGYVNEQAEFGTLGAGQDALTRGGYNSSGPLPFRAVTGAESKPGIVKDPQSGLETYREGLSEFFSPQSTNEQPIVLIDSAGTATVGFEIQTAAANPYLGCGDPDSAAGQRCWLVVIPRGSHYGGIPDSDASCMTDGYNHGAAPGDPYLTQTGSPVSPDCSYFDHRVVVPLSFDPAFLSCAAGAEERRIVGSELAAEAISSWQGTLCTSGDPKTYSFVTNSGFLNRDQLLTGQAGMALTALPLTEDTVSDASAALVADAEVAYAPVLNGGIALAFVASDGLIAATGGKGVTRFTDIKLTPRLVAKLLTQQYRFQVPHIDWHRPDSAWLESTTHSISTDVDWTRLGNPRIEVVDSSLVILGPRGDDAIQLLWQWIQSDESAVAYLRGEPDNVRPGDEGNLGLTLNPYYLPTGHPGAAGGGLPYDLATEVIDTIPRADQSRVPDTDAADTDYRGLQMDSLTLLPYAGSFEATANRVLKADTRITRLWDPSKLVSPGVVGAFVATGPTPEGRNRVVIGPVDAATAHLYGLDVASLQVPNQAGAFVRPTPATIQTTIDTAMRTAPDGVTTTVDFAALNADTYPLATTLYAAVDLARDVDGGARSDYGKFLRYAATDGQVPGTLRGQLPEGYVPLTQAQRATALALADRLERDRDDNPLENSSAGLPAEETGSPPAGNSSTPETTQKLAADTRVAVSADEASATTAPTSSGLQSVLGAALAAGVVGAIAGPFLLRKRGAT